MALAHCIQHGHTPSDLNEVDPKRFAPEFNSANALATRVSEVWENITKLFILAGNGQHRVV